MEKNMDDHLISTLKEGRNLNISLLSHNAYWPEIQKLNNHFKNCNVMVFGGSTTYIKLANEKRHNEIKNSDLFILYSSEFYNEEELAELKDIAFTIANDKEKRVSIGYLYQIPVEQRPHQSISEQIKIVSFKNDEEIIEETYPTPYFTPYDLINLTLTTTDNYDTDKRCRLEKKL